MVCLLERLRFGLFSLPVVFEQLLKEFFGGAEAGFGQQVYRFG